MQVTTCLTPINIAPESLADAVAVVIDTLRMTSTAATAIANGCAGILPIAEEDEARRIAARMPDALLGGERVGGKLPGFDLGNSPFEYTPDAVGGKRVISTTTNGTRVLVQAAPAKTVLIGALINARAVAEHVHGVDKLTLVCAGTYDQFSMEDVVTAGCILAHLQSLGCQPALDDASVGALWLYEQVREDLFGMVSQTKHSRFLMSFGGRYAEDVRYCLAQDVLDVVAEIRQGWIVNARG